MSTAKQCKCTDIIWHNMFIDCLTDLSKAKVKVVLVNDIDSRLTLDGDTACRGYWDDNNWRKPELHCQVTKTENWIETFVHEYCHFRQWKERCDVWKKCRRFSQDDDDTLYSGEYMHPTRMNNFIAATRELEADCEKRTVSMFKQYNIPQSDIDKYIRQANVYINFYTYVKWYRTWPSAPADSPSKQPECLSAASTQFQKDYSIIPDDLLQVFINKFPPICEVTQ